MENKEFGRCVAAGIAVVAAKTRQSQRGDWTYVVLAEDMEKHLATHRCEPIADTYVKILRDLRADPNLFLSDEMLQRINKVIENPKEQL